MQGLWKQFFDRLFAGGREREETSFRFGYVSGRFGFSLYSRVVECKPCYSNELGKKYGSELSQIRNPKPVQVLELDELHTYVQSKKTTNGFGLLLIEMQESSLISFLELEEQKPE